MGRVLTEEYERVVDWETEVGSLGHRYLYVLARKRCDELNQGDPMKRPVEYRPKKADLGWEIMGYQAVLVPK